MASAFLVAASAVSCSRVTCREISETDFTNSSAALETPVTFVAAKREAVVAVVAFVVVSFAAC